VIISFTYAFFNIYIIIDGTCFLSSTDPCIVLHDRNNFKVRLEFHTLLVLNTK